MLSLHHLGNTFFKVFWLLPVVLFMPIVAIGSDFSPDLHSNDTLPGVLQPVKTKPIRVAFSYGSTFGMAAPEFFEDYRSTLQSPSSTFGLPNSLSLSLCQYLTSSVSVGVIGQYYRLGIRESYVYRESPLNNASPSHNLSQELVITALPAFVVADYYPTNRQFTTYVGAGAGVAVTSLFWKETVESDTKAGRPGGVYYDRTHVVPTGIIRSGISLGWDRAQTTKTSAAVTLDVNYTIVSVSAPLMEELAKYLEPKSGRGNSSYRFQLGGFGISVGITVIFR